MTDNRQERWAIFARVLSGESTPSEESELALAMEGDPELRADFARARSAWAEADAAPGAWDVDAALEVVLSRARSETASVKRSPTPGARSIWRFSATSAALAAALFFTYLVSLRPRHRPADAGHVFATRAGARADLRLVDSTRVVLGPSSELRLASDFGGATRTVSVNGDAYFEVAHDLAHPFIVHAGATVTRVVGTRFSVNTCAIDDAVGAECRVRVVVREGTVVVRATEGSADSLTLTRGLVGDLPPHGPPSLVARPDTGLLLAWTAGRLVLARRALADAAPEIARWYGITVRFSNPALGARRVTASFDHESAHEAAAVVAALAGLRAVWSADTVTFAPLTSPPGILR